MKQSLSFLSAKSGFGLALLAFGLFSVNSADAAMIATLSPTSSGNTFIYDINFSNSTDMSSGQPAERVDAPGTGNSTFVTVYDLFGVTPASITLTAAGMSRYTLSVQPSGITPPGTLPTDTGLFNFTVTYIGPATTVDFSDAAVVAVVSSSSTRGFSNYTGQDTKNSGGAAGTIASNIGFVVVPVSGVPEPASMLMLGGGLLGLGLIRRRSSKTAA